MPEERERLKIWSRDGPMELKTSFKIVVGMMSSGLVEVFILLTSLVKRQRETGAKESKIHWLFGGRWGVGVVEMMLDLMVSTLFTKNERNALQSVVEKTGVTGVGGQTMLFMVSNSTLGLRLLEEINLVK